MSDYPEHDRLVLVAAETQAAGEFLEWLAGEKGLGLAVYEERYGRHMPVMVPLEMLLAEWQGVDPVRLEQEKWHMLKALRGETTGG